VNESIPILLQLCARLSYIVMLMTGVLQALTFLFFLLLGGHGLIGGGGADTSEWVYMTCTFALPLASACFYFRWPWGPVLVCWSAIAASLLNPNFYPLRSSYYPHIAFVIAAHIGLASYIALKLSGQWPLKTLRA
jgi:hypothetical protein